MATIGNEIEKQKKVIADTKRKIENLKAKEAKRILRIAERVGYFEVSVTDEQLETAMKEIVKTATEAKSNTTNGNAEFSQ